MGFEYSIEFAGFRRWEYALKWRIVLWILILWFMNCRKERVDRNKGKGRQFSTKSHRRGHDPFDGFFEHLEYPRFCWCSVSSLCHSFSLQCVVDLVIVFHARLTISPSSLSLILARLEVWMLGQFDVAHARRRELEGPYRRALVHVVRVDGEQVLECVPLHAQRLPAAVRHLQTWKHTKPLSTLSKVQYITRYKCTEHDNFYWHWHTLCVIRSFRETLLCFRRNSYCHFSCLAAQRLVNRPVKLLWNILINETLKLTSWRTLY